MTETALWSEPLYKETVGLIILFLLIIGSVLYFLRQKNPKLTTAWVSVKSWIFAAPFILFTIGLPYPYPFVVLVFIAIFSTKTYYRMVGMYHRSWFVWLTYIFIFLLSYMIYSKQTKYYNLTPMLFLFACSFIPLFRNSSKHMIQYIALSLIGFIFLGWSFLHIGLILNFEKGMYIILYLYILTEFSFNSAAFYSRFFGKLRVLSKISKRFTLDGYLFSIFFTLLAAWGLRHLLPESSEIFWVASAIIVSTFGRAGDLFLSVIRRDLGLKDSGVFIIGREDLLASIDKFIFLPPIFYYIFQYLLKID